MPIQNTLEEANYDEAFQNDRGVSRALLIIFKGASFVNFPLAHSTIDISQGTDYAFEWYYKFCNAHYTKNKVLLIRISSVNGTKSAVSLVSSLLKVYNFHVNY